MMNLRLPTSLAAPLLLLGASVACGGDDSGGGTTGSGGAGNAGSTTSTGGSSSSTVGSTVGSATTTASTSTGGAGTGGTGGSGGSGVTLTVKNYLSWCNVSVAGGAPQTAAEQTVSVAPGTVVDLTATAASSLFVLGSTPWHDTDGDQGSGDPGTMTGSGMSAQSATTETVSGTDCVWVCCPFTDLSGCPALDQCP